jgi:hypothetical protein
MLLPEMAAAGECRFAGSAGFQPALGRQDGGAPSEEECVPEAGKIALERASEP